MASNAGDSDGPPPTRRKRTDLSEHEDTLEALYQGGLNHYGTPENRDRLKAEAARIGIPEETIKIWIGNRKRKDKEKKEAGNSLWGKNTTGYDMFRRDQMKGKKGPAAVGAAGHAWSRLKVEDPEKWRSYMEQAEATKLPTLEEASVDAKKKAALKLWRDIENATRKLESLGCDCFMIMYDGTREGMWGVNTPVARKFFYGLTKDLELDFRAACRAPRLQTQAPSIVDKDKDKKGLVQKVREALNGIVEATPGLKGAFPYSKLYNTVAIEGLPETLIVKNLHDMSIANLRLILAHKDNITLHVVEEVQGDLSESAEHLEPLETNEEVQGDLSESEEHLEPLETNAEQVLLGVTRGLQQAAQGNREEVSLEEPAADRAVGTSTRERERRGAFSMLEDFLSK